LEPRQSFKTWTETVAGKCSEWTEEEIETAAVLCLVYGKFIKVLNLTVNRLGLNLIVDHL
jgi:light-regulated signal transduction histidine kinase (bacteriophytochrome)